MSIPFHLDLPTLEPLVPERSAVARVHGVVHPPDPGQVARGTVVICHGFKGFCGWGFFPPLARLLAARGFAAVRFDFGGTGQGPDDERVTDLDAFRRNTFSRERDELLAVLGRLGEIVPSGVPDRVALLGHSRGGGAVLLAAAALADDPGWRDRLGALVTWASVASFDRYRQHEDAWRRDGVLPIENGRTGQRLELGVELLDDVVEHGAALDLEAAARRLRVPWLIVHGTDDETVPVAEARRLEAAATGGGGDGAVELHEVEGGSHTFGAQHPFAGPTRELTEAMNVTQVWLRRYLS